MFLSINGFFIISDGGQNIIEVKCSLSRAKFEVMDQAIAQTIVFSFFQEKKNPDIFIPNILISPEEFRVIMYNAKHDLLICSQPLDLFTKKASESKTPRCLDNMSIGILWMVLHYETFLAKVSFLLSKECIKIVKAMFKTETSVYREEKGIQLYVKSFPPEEKKDYFPDSTSLADGKNVFSGELVEKLNKIAISSKSDVMGSKKNKRKSTKTKKDK